MNAAELAKQAALSTADFGKALSPLVVLKLELAFVSQWVDQQDDSIDPAKVLKTAREAMGALRHVYEMQHGPIHA